MSEITLSKAVRSNLLNLQSTASLLSKSQERLSSGLRVNSALDNPTNFFTAQGLNSRANDLSQLSDAVSNAVQTVAAADKGISAITKLVESAQATARQALQTAATVSTGTAADAGTVSAGGFTTLNVSGAGSAAQNASVVGTSAITPIVVAGAQNAELTGSGAITPITLNAATNAEATATSAYSPVDASGGGFSFEINGQAVTLSATGGTNSDGIYTLSDMVQTINTQVGVSAGVVAADDGNGNLQITSTGTAGAADAVTIDTFAGTGFDATDLGFAGATVSTNGSAAQSLTFQVNNQTVTLGAGTHTGTDIATAITNQVGVSAGVSASYANNALTVTSTGTAGASDAVTIGTFSSGNASQLGLAAQASVTDNGSNLVAADSVSFSLAVDGASPTTITIDAAAVTAYNTANNASLSASALSAQNVADIINHQSGPNVASVVSGALTFTSTTTGTGSSIAITGYSASATAGSTGIANNSDTGSASSTTSGVNPKRAELVNTYNDLLGQIDALAKDASFNGVNLLNGDDLSVLFNEDGSSSLQIDGVTNTSTGLGLTALGTTAFDTNTSINSTLDDLKASIDTLRSQSAKFGSNLSVVETRQDFTKQMISVLQTGAANLTLADTNEEAANVLALQTRQQLSSTALSLASQADQNVLRLF